ncbi:hypothetical protein [Falsirhodobacter sp. 1013]|uniref:hypothetical protein n=1 Tax=Falsirhodobacter sp. 1013 TaxID=3417566 RepID=UPI003EBD0531
MEVLNSVSDAPVASAYDIYVEVQTVLGLPALTKAQWVDSMGMKDSDRELIATGVAAAAEVKLLAEQVEESRDAVGAAMVKATKAAKQASSALEQVRQAAQVVAQDRAAVAASVQTVAETDRAVSAKVSGAATSATTAAAKATEAGASAELAATNAAAAATSATAAGAKATEAGTRAAAAAASATTATTKAAEASASVQVAATKAAEATAARDAVLAKLEGVGGIEADLASVMQMIASLTAQVDQLLGGAEDQPQPLRDELTVETTPDTIVVHG